MNRRAWLNGTAASTLAAILPASAPAQSPITHKFLVCGGATYIRDGDGKVTW